MGGGEGLHAYYARFGDNLPRLPSTCIYTPCTECQRFSLIPSVREFCRGFATQTENLDEPWEFGMGGTGASECAGGSNVT